MMLLKKYIYLNLNRGTERLTDIQIEGQRGTDTSRLRDRPGQRQRKKTDKEEQMDRRTERDRQTERQTDRQIGREID